VRVLFLSDVYFPRVNGVSTSINTFRADLAQCEVDTTLIAPEYGSSAETPEPGVVRVSAAPVPGDPEDRRMRWRALKHALEAVARERFDLVHIHTPFVAHYAGVRFARLQSIPSVATYHTYFEEYLHHYVPVLPRTLGRLLARTFTRAQCADVDALVAPSEPLREVLLAYGVTTPVHIVPTGLAADRFRPGDGRRFRAFAGIAPERPLLLYVGRVAHEKNIGFLLRSFVRVRDQVPDAVLVVAGEGPARPALRQLAQRLGIADQVYFVGYLDRETLLLDCYAAAQVFVFASRTETQGLVLLEAMAQGAPIVSTAELGTRSVLQPASGALVVPESIARFATAIVHVLNDPRRQQQMSARARAYALNWTAAAMAQKLRGVYESVLAQTLRRRDTSRAASPPDECVGTRRQ
jgi:glycosyltransferase involved in cell wall biosynthesis